LQMKCRMCR